jgi:hypothetical protein
MKRFVTVLVMIVLAGLAYGQRITGYNYDEAKIPAYTMLDPMTLADGQVVSTPMMWWRQRRPEIVRLFEENEFGVTPPKAKALPLRTKVVEEDAHALGGLAVRRQVDVYFTDRGAEGKKMRLLLYLPTNAKGPVPVVVGLNFGGNHTVLDDAGILPTEVWSEPKPEKVLTHAAPVGGRGSQTKEWQVERVLGRGYGLATVYYGDIEPDFQDAEKESVRALFREAGTPRKGDEWGAIGAWAWGLSRVADYLVTLKEVDAKRLVVTGHSRLGKAADWAAAQDGRFAVLLSTESGHGGQTIQRRALGETVAHLEHSFPHWFCPNYAEWVGKDAEIPVDGNLLLSLIAPRPVYVASAVEDEWSDPKGEFLAAVSVGRVYRLLGKRGLATDTMPGVDGPLHSAQSAVGYHERAGVHDVTAFDWEQYLDFLDQQFGRTAAR